MPARSGSNKRRRCWQLSVRLSPDEWRRFEAAAKQVDKTKQQWLRDLADAEIERRLAQ